MDHLKVQSTLSDSLVDLANAFTQRASTLAPKGKCDLDNNHLMVFSYLKNDAENVFWWVLQYFCELGWEPFSIAHDGLGIDRLPQIHLRKEIVT